MMFRPTGKGKQYNFQGEQFLSIKKYVQANLKTCALDWFRGDSQFIFVNGIKLQTLMQAMGIKPIASYSEEYGQQLVSIWKDFLLSKFSNDKPIPIFTPEQEQEFIHLFEKLFHQGGVLYAMRARLQEMILEKLPTAQLQDEHELFIDRKGEKIIVTESVKFSKIGYVHDGQIKPIAEGKYLVEGASVHVFSLDKDNHCKCEVMATSLVFHHDKVHDLFLGDFARKMQTVSSLSKLYHEYKKQLEKDEENDNSEAILSINHLLHILESKTDTVDANLEHFSAKLLKEKVTIESEGGKSEHLTSHKVSANGRKLVSETMKMLHEVGEYKLHDDELIEPTKHKDYGKFK